MDGFTLDPSKPQEKEALRGPIVWNLWVDDSGLMWDWLAQPINLIANTNLNPGLSLGVRRAELVAAIVDTLAKIKRQNLGDEQVKELMRTELVPKFLALNKCPDFIEDKGHEFGRSLTMEDKRAADRAAEDVLRMEKTYDYVVV